MDIKSKLQTKYQEKMIKTKNERLSKKSYIKSYLGCGSFKTAMPLCSPVSDIQKDDFCNISTFNQYKLYEEPWDVCEEKYFWDLVLGRKPQCQLEFKNASC